MSKIFKGDKRKLKPIGYVSDDIILLVKDDDETHMKQVLVGDSNNIVILGSVARFRPYEEVVLVEK